MIVRKIAIVVADQDGIGDLFFPKVGKEWTQLTRLIGSTANRHESGR